MVAIVTKKIKGNEYLYLVHNVRENGKSIQKTIKYIGKKRPIPKEEFECMKYSFGGKDWVLSDFEDFLSYQDHEAMKLASKMQKKYYDSLDNISKQKQKQKFLSNFIANSNEIEGSTMTPDNTFRYLFEGTVPSCKSKKELFMADNMIKACEYIEQNCDRMPGTDDLMALHKLVNSGIEDKKTLGCWKPVQNYVGTSITSSYLFVDEKIAKLFDWLADAEKHIDDFEIAFQSHAQFEIIHPFVDGNGRIGRLLMNWLLIKNNLEPFAIRFSRRNEYLEALENSKRGKVKTICRFCMEEYLATWDFM